MKKSRLIFFTVILGFMLILFRTAPAEAASSSEIQNQIDALQEKEASLQDRLAELETRLNENADELEEMVEKKNALDQQITLIMESIENTQEQISAYARLIADKQEELDAAEERLAQLHLAYKSRIRAMEEEGDLSYWAVLFRADSFSDFLDRINMIQDIARADRTRLQKISESAAQVEAAQMALLQEKAALEQVKQVQLSSEQQLREKNSQTAALLTELLAQGNAFEALLEKSEEEQHKLMDEIAKLEDDYDEAVYQEWLATYVPPTTAIPEAPDHATPPGDAEWLTPVPYYTLTSPFGMRMHPILGYERMHNGVDLACAEWTPIYATRGGKVTIATNSDSAGLYVQINHGDGYRSVYMHMVHYEVSVGDYVAQGQVIGYVGNTGLSKGNHLHFGISYNGEYVNPMEYIG